MNNMNSGYSGWSMSNRAVAAYEDGEMPKSKWTKKAMLAAMAECLEENEVELDEKQVKNLEHMPKDIMFNMFFYRSSWHHTSKYANETDFFALNDGKFLDAVEETNFEVTYNVEIRIGDRTLDRSFGSEKELEAYLKKNGQMPDFKLGIGRRTWAMGGKAITKWEVLK